MSDDADRAGLRGRLLDSAGAVGAGALRPVTGVVGTAAGLGISLERRAVGRAGDELERVLKAAINSAPVQAAVDGVMHSEAVDRVVDGLFDGGVIDRVLDRLLDTGTLDRFLVRLPASEGLWTLIDEISASPAVTAAISQQGFSFADQVGGAVRQRSRKADDRVERAARRLIHRQAETSPQPDAGT